MKTGTKTAEQLTEEAEHGRSVWIAITVITISVSLVLNIVHPIVFEPEPVPNMPLNEIGRTLLGLLSGLLPVTMQALMSHAIFTRAPRGVKLVVLVIFAIGMIMSVSHQYQLFLPAVGHVNAMGTVAVIDIPALTALFMIERGNRLQQSAERLSAERARQARETAERERRERLEAERRAARQAEEDKRRAAQRAADERLAERNLAAAQAAERAAEAERQAAAQAAETERERQAAAEAERLAAERRAAAEAAEAKRLEREREAAAEAARLERERRERMEAQQSAEAERRETERLEREQRAAAERAEAERKEAERRERAERAAERKAAAELAERGDISPEQKKEVIRALYLKDNTVKAPAAVAAVVAEGGTISDQRARAILAEVRQEEGGLAEVRQLRKTAAV